MTFARRRKCEIRCRISRGVAYRDGMATVAHARGIFSGGIILTVFGGFWCFIALANWPARPAWSIPLGAALMIALLVPCIVRLAAAIKAPAVHDPVAAAAGKRDGMLFGIIFGIEGGLIALTSTVLARQGLGIWIPFAVALIVGLHFLPLAHVFRVPLYYATGILSVLGVLACLLIQDPATRVLGECMVMAAVLWSSVAFLLLQTRVTVSQSGMAAPE